MVSALLSRPVHEREVYEDDLRLLDRKLEDFDLWEEPRKPTAAAFIVLCAVATGTCIAVTVAVHTVWPF